MTHGTRARYTHDGCRCRSCTRASNAYHRHNMGRCRPEDGCDYCKSIVLVNFPVALVARQAFPDDDAAIAAAFGGTT